MKKGFLIFLLVIGINYSWATATDCHTKRNRTACHDAIVSNIIAGQTTLASEQLDSLFKDQTPEQKLTHVNRIAQRLQIAAPINFNEHLENTRLLVSYYNDQNNYGDKLQDYVVLGAIDSSSHSVLKSLNIQPNRILQDNQEYSSRDYHAIPEVQTAIENSPQYVARQTVRHYMPGGDVTQTLELFQSLTDEVIKQDILSQMFLKAIQHRANEDALFFLSQGLDVRTNISGDTVYCDAAKLILDHLIDSDTPDENLKTELIKELDLSGLSSEIDVYSTTCGRDKTLDDLIHQYIKGSQGKQNTGATKQQGQQKTQAPVFEPRVEQRGDTTIKYMQLTDTQNRAFFVKRISSGQCSEKIFDEQLDYLIHMASKTQGRFTEITDHQNLENCKTVAISSSTEFR